MPTLHWIGKEHVLNHHRDVPFKVLDHSYSYNGDTQHQEPTASPSGGGNKIIHGDNLEALKALLPEYEGKITCIYIDPPYNTGNEGWIYNDNVNAPKIKKWLGQVVGKESEDLSRHDKWLCMMYPRLKLLHKLLAENGAIFISIDDNEQANLKLIMDEIFGSGNLVAVNVWEKIHSIKNDAKYLSVNHEFILFYAKNITNIQVNLLNRTDEMNARYTNPDNDPRGAWQSGDLVANETRKDGNYDVVGPSGQVFNVPSGKHWVYSQENMLQMIAENRIWFGKNGTAFPRKKRFLSEVTSGRKGTTWWQSEDVGHNQEGKREIKEFFGQSEELFSTPKPTRLIQRVLELATSPDSLILDSFAGSGTTAHAVLNLNKQDGGNRKFILIEMEAYAESITAERVKRVIQGYGTTEGTGGAFDFYTIGAPMFDEEGNLNESVGVERIRGYVWYTETKTPLGTAIEAAADNAAFLGKHNDTAYYFHYEADGITTLSHTFLASVRTRAEEYVIYADNCLLPAEALAARKIIFKKIPRDITRF